MIGCDGVAVTGYHCPLLTHLNIRCSLDEVPRGPTMFYWCKRKAHGPVPCCLVTIQEAVKASSIIEANPFGRSMGTLDLTRVSPNHQLQWCWVLHALSSERWSALVTMHVALLVWCLFRACAVLSFAHPCSRDPERRDSEMRNQHDIQRNCGSAKTSNLLLQSPDIV